MFFSLRYFWRLSKGHRLRPWRSPLVRWRFETFFGIHAETLTAGQFFALLWRERRRIEGFLHWAEEMERKVAGSQSDRVTGTGIDSETL